jgi:hypothetical protein
MVLSLAGLGNKDRCAGEGRQQFGRKAGQFCLLKYVAVKIKVFQIVHTKRIFE